MREEKIIKIFSELELGYNQMADKFSNTRKNFWRDLEFIADYIGDGDVVLDYGCGNGRFLEIIKNKKINYTGVDISQKLIDLARKKYPNQKNSFFKIASQASLAFSDNFFNRIISVAVFHHFPEEYAREKARELYRITKPGGQVIITTWNLWQKKHWKNIFNFFISVGKIFHIGKYADFGFYDIFVPFKNNQGAVFNRYHRVYTGNSLAKIFLSAGFEIEKCFLQNKKNIVLIVRKKIKQNYAIKN